MFQFGRISRHAFVLGHSGVMVGEEDYVPVPVFVISILWRCWFASFTDRMITVAESGSPTFVKRSKVCTLVLKRGIMEGKNIHVDVLVTCHTSSGNCHGALVTCFVCLAFRTCLEMKSQPLVEN